MINSGFFNAVKQSDGTYDRSYNARNINEFLKGLISADGIFLNVDDMFVVEAGSGMNVIVKKGKAMVHHYWAINDADEPLSINSSHVTLNRWTAIVLRLNIIDRAISLLSIDGEPAVEPIKPELIRNETEYDLCLAYIYVSNGITELTQSVIEDTRGYDYECGFIHGLIEQIDTTTLFKQYTKAFANFYTANTHTFENWLTNLTNDLNCTVYFQRRAQVLTTTEKIRRVEITLDNFVYGDIVYVYLNGLKLIEIENYNIRKLLDENDNVEKYYVVFDFDVLKDQTIEIVCLKPQIGFAPVVEDPESIEIDDNNNSENNNNTSNGNGPDDNSGDIEELFDIDDDITNEYP